MADIQALVASAKRKLQNGEAIYPLDAARKAIKGQGIFNKSDIQRLTKQMTPYLPTKTRRAS